MLDDDGAGVARARHAGLEVADEAEGARDGGVAAGALVGVLEVLAAAGAAAAAARRARGRDEVREADDSARAGERAPEVRREGLGSR